MTTAAFILTAAANSAQAQTAYQSGAPTMVAAAPSFPTIPAEQIARDVTEEFNPRTGERELVAAPFDAFEDDTTLAGSVRLRSAEGAVAIDGQRLRDGALLEVDFYYNSPSDDPFGGRGYSDASFVNGELAPAVLRDSRILECSTRVENVVYDHTTYYRRGSSIGLYRPYRHYAGHRGFGFGFGTSYYGPGYGYYNRHHRARRGYSGSARNARPGIHSRVLGATRGRDRDRADDRRRDRRSDDRVRAGERDRSGDRNTRGNTRRGQSDRQRESRARRVESYGSGNTRSSARRNGAMRGVNPERRIEMATPSATSRSATRPSTSQAGGNTSSRGATPRVRAPRSQTPRAQTPRAQTPRSETRRSAPRTETRSAPRSQRSKAPSPRSRPAPQRSKNPSSNVRRKLNFFPNDGYGGRDVVTSQSVDCAREDKLRVFIPNERLDAARFDGLTVVALDTQGGETPIYIPPNYIEGYRLAASGQVRPQGLGAPTTPPSSFEPAPRRGVIEAAPCPSGTTSQPDGTCLQTGSIGYPVR